MNRSTTIGWIDGVETDQRLEVALVQKDAGPLEFVMSEQHYADGIGWFTQRSMTLDARQASQLKRLLTAHDLPREKTEPIRPAAPSTLKLHQRPPVDDQPLADVG